MTRPPEVPSGPEDQPADYVAGRLHQAFATDPRVGDPTIKVSIKDKRVHLQGYVNSRERKQALTQVAQEQASGYEIHNEVQVASPGGTGQMETLQ